MSEYVCPLENVELIEKDCLYVSKNGREYRKILIEDTEVADFRCLDVRSTVSLQFELPVQIISEVDDWKRFGIATEADFQTLSREEFRSKYGTKLQKEIAFYFDVILREKGSSIRILDLGCGDGATKKYLNSLGFDNVTSVDWYHKNADALVDVHRMPFKESSFDVILTTATLEHFYHPFVAFSEMSRVLSDDGRLIASGSFWESWHGDSCFHSTPAGLKILCDSAELTLLDVWSGWGFIPSVSSHALGLSRFKPVTYFIQRVFDNVLRLIKGPELVKQHRFRTSGSFGIYAVKNHGE